MLTLGVLAVVVLTQAGCFEEPVDERLQLCFLPGGQVVLTAVGEIRSPSGEQPRPALQQRIADARRDFGAGWESWNPRFESLAPASERVILDRIDGTPQRVVRQARVDDPAELARFFALTDVTVTYEVEHGMAVFSVYPRGSTRATHWERRRTETTIASWSRHLAAYLDATADLYAWLADHPERARLCLAHLFGLGSDRDGELVPEEAVLVTAASDGISMVATVLEVQEGEAFTLDEISHRVFDPFPARFTVVVPAEPEDVQGFDLGSDQCLAVPGLGLWAALEKLAGRWVEPDPALTWVAYLRQERGDDATFLERFLARQRVVTAVPSAEEVEGEVRRMLEPSGIYSVSWAHDDAAERTSPGDWQSLPCLRSPLLPGAACDHDPGIPR